jgi:hypothetical protein
VATQDNIGATVFNGTMTLAEGRNSHESTKSLSQ